MGGHLKKARALKGLNQVAAAKLLAVCQMTYIHWERDQTAEIPAICMPKVIEFIGYNPEPEPQAANDRLKWKRRTHGYTAKSRGVELGIHECTVCAREAGEVSAEHLSDIQEYLGDSHFEPLEGRKYAGRKAMATSQRAS